jgi:hypothetical protein
MDRYAEARIDSKGWTEVQPEVKPKRRWFRRRKAMQLTELHGQMRNHGLIESADLTVDKGGNMELMNIEGELVRMKKVKV